MKSWIGNALTIRPGSQTSASESQPTWVITLLREPNWRDAVPSCPWPVPCKVFLQLAGDLWTIKQISVETSTWYRVPHSVTTVAWVKEGTIFVPCGGCSGKRWPRNVAARPDVRLKIDGEIYPRIARRVTDLEELRWALDTPVTEEPPPDVAVFRMEVGAGSRAPGP